MKQLRCLLIFLFSVSVLQAQVTLPRYPDSLFSTYYHQRLTHFRSLPQTKSDIIFIGNSITDGGEWSELFIDLKVKNRGISGDVTAGVLNRIGEVAQRKPAKVFLLIGTNDLARNIAPDTVVKNILLIAYYLNQQTPSTQLFVQSILPVNGVFGKFSGHTNKGEQIKQVNEKLKQQATTYFYTFIDLYSSFADENGKLKKDLTNDGLHLLDKGYLLWKHLVYPFVYDLEKQPSLLPLPQKFKWQDGYFLLYESRAIFVNDKTLQNEAQWLQREFQKEGVNLSLKSNAQQKEEKAIVLQLSDVDAPMLKEEAFRLDVSDERVLLTANTAHGIFNGIQTLLQLARDGTIIDACTITDWPAFSWRGYMIDVGRNYMSMDLLKQQIDVMSRYKFNIFHFHFTEDIAWRLAIKQYPQLTTPQNMLRDKGQYYTEAEMKELIAYCKERYITIVPEIDMPGHSAAFKRAMGFEMQSDSGLIAVKNIIKEFIQTYDLPYMHIGADEVKITNQKFVPEVTSFVQSFGKRVIGWEPGGNFTDNTIRQLWMDDNGKISRNENIQYIDSRHLYLNHMDPLESVVTIYNRRIADKEKGDKNASGATLCMWHDRAIGKEDDILKMNPVYPGMLAFAERVWRGGGHTGWTATIGAPSSEKANEFANFEKRLLDHKLQYFSVLPFPYVKQSSTIWKLFGPYANGGNLSAKFDPENNGLNTDNIKPTLEVVGGTIVFRHWWAPLIKATITQPEDSTTWYAATKIRSDEEAVKEFWIGFNNLSRSPATDSPPIGAWDNKSSVVWVNGKLISPPVWKHSGQKGHPEIPLTDESYEYREPAKIQLRKGWNDVLIKLPVGYFKGKDWQNPVKWMFTFVLL